jgi:hypothetical protein
MTDELRIGSALIQAVSRHLLGGTEEIHENSQSRQTVFWPIEPQYMSRGMTLHSMVLIIYVPKFVNTSYIRF